MLPERIGRYEIRGIAGSGGFATVYEAFDPRLDARIAIKVLADNWSSDPEIRRRFRQEAVLLRRLQSEQGVPGLVDVFDVDQTETGQPFFVMGWAGGDTLSARTKGRVCTPEELAPVVKAMTQSLGHLHARGVVHRDIKPQNLLIRSDGTPETFTGLLGPGERIIVGDFGLAKDLTADASSLSLVAGTKRYMAPEQLVFGGRIDHRADIYAATAMIADLLTNRGANPLPPGLQPFVDRGQAHEPHDRFATMAEWQDAFFAGATSSLDPTAAVANTPATAIATATDAPSTATPVPSTTAGAAPTNPAAPAWQASSSTDDETVFSTARSTPNSKPASGTTTRLLIGAAAIAALIIGFVLLTGTDTTIVGPATIESGETAEYSVDGATAVVWADPAGSIVDGPTLSVTGRLPGQLTVSAVANNEQFRRTITVTESVIGPHIIGPQIVRSGEQGTFAADIPDGHTFYWLHPTLGRLTTPQVSVVQADASFTLGLISIDQSGVERGDQVLVMSR